jgi:hypothetical protein
MFSRMSIFAMFLLLFASLLCNAQTATCTHWTFFNGFSPSGINRWGTVVGATQAVFFSKAVAAGQSNDDSIAGIIRYANGDTETYIDPNSLPTGVTLLTRRNKFGVTVGWYSVDVADDAHGLLLSGSTATTVDYPGAIATIINGINYKGTMVGIWGLGDFSQPYDGFKMSKNGAVTTIAAPGAMQTNPASISDTGVIVGWYVPRDAQPPFPDHGFVLANGVYKTVDYPKTFRTFLNDINASGVIVGSWGIPNNGVGGGFLYVNGGFKDVKGPNVQVWTVDGINDYGYVTGTSSGGSFTAHCQ